MNTNESGLSVVSSKPESVRVVYEFSIGQRIIAPIVVFIALGLGTAQWLESGRDAMSVSAAQQEPQARGAAEKFEYFPAGYDNKAKVIEEHIQAF
jgi:hypothetical protein